MKNSLFQYTLHLADNAVIIAQRNSEWTGHGPVLEQDIAITNIALDYLGQARNLYQYAADIYNNASSEEKATMDSLLPQPWKSYGRPLEEDDLAFLRDERQFLNLLITELPKGDWAYTVLRQFFFSTFQFFQYRSLLTSNDETFAAIAEKSIKEVEYHLRWSAEWVIRLGDGTEESAARLAKAFEDLSPFVGEAFKPAKFEEELSSLNIIVSPSNLLTPFTERVASIFEASNLKPFDPSSKTWSQSGGKIGQHTEYLGYLLTEMQMMQRRYPNMTW